jgi:hypothetical protein
MDMYPVFAAERQGAKLRPGKKERSLCELPKALGARGKGAELRQQKIGSYMSM